jgi:hypothetical protein
MKYQMCSCIISNISSILCHEYALIRTTPTSIRRSQLTDSNGVVKCRQRPTVAFIAIGSHFSAKKSKPVTLDQGSLYCRLTLPALPGYPPCPITSTLR